MPPNRRVQVRTGPDRWLIQDGETSGWLDTWIVEAILAIAKQVDDANDRWVIELAEHQEE